jgi:hypothetical protein
VDQFAALGVVPAPLNTAEQFGEFLRHDFAFWKRISAEIGVRPN